MTEDSHPALHPVDLEADGRQHGWLSTGAGGREGDGDHGHPGIDRLRVPLVCMKNGQGPTIVLCSGASGLETSGPVVLSRLAGMLEIERLQGRVLIVPDLSAGHLGTAMSSTLSTQRQIEPLLSAADLVIDIRATVPGLQCEALATTLPGTPATAAAAAAAAADQSPGERADQALVAFGAPNSLPECRAVQRVLAGAARDDSSPAYLACHLGDGPLASPNGIEAGLTGCLNVLVQQALYDTPFQLRASRTLRIDPRKSLLHSDRSGWLEMHRITGQDIYPDSPLATIHAGGYSGWTPDGQSHTLRATYPGILLAHRAGGPVNPGDCLAMIADEIRP